MVAKVIDLRKGKQPVIRTRTLPLREPPAPKRPSPLRARRRRARAALVGMILLGIAALIYGVHLASYLPALSIVAVNVTGEEKIDGGIITTYVESQLSDGSFHFFSRRNIFFYPKEVIESGIVSSFPRVRSAELSRPELFSRELIVRIEERQPYALWCRSEEDCYAIDDTGFVFTTAATSTRVGFETVYTFFEGIEGDPIGSRFIPDQLSTTFSLLRIIERDANLIPYRLDVLPDHDISISVEQGFYIKVSFGQDPEQLVRNLELVLSSDALRERIAEIEYIDLRFGNRVYYKMKGEEQEDF